jgi:hypothetical protein
MPGQIGRETATGRFPFASTWYPSTPGTTPRPGLEGAAVDGGLARCGGLLPVLLDESVPQAAVVLAQEQGSELGEPIARWSSERPHDRLASDRETQSHMPRAIT